MNRYAFTLIELMISIALTVIMVFFLYKALAIQEKANETLQKKSDAIHKKNQLFTLIYKDFKKADKTEIINTFNKDYNIFAMQTKNSLHNIPFAYVVYYVNAKDKTLIRLESALPIHLPVAPERVTLVFSDVLEKGIEKFRLFLSAKSRRKIKLLPGTSSSSDHQNKRERANYFVFIKIRKKTIYFSL